MAFLDHAFYDSRMLLRLASQHEERSVGTSALKQIEQLGGKRTTRPIVIRQGEDSILN